MVTMKGRNKKIQSFIQLALFIGVLLFVNIIGNYFYTSLDLTEEKRFTLTKATTNTLEELKDEITVRVFLEGEFPAGIQRLRSSIEEMLKDFRGVSPRINFTFDNPTDGSVEEVNSRKEQLAAVGINPSSLKVPGVDEVKTILFYPWALVNYGERQIAVNFLENSGLGRIDDVTINNSISLLEYNLANAIQKLVVFKRPTILFSQGHDELNARQTADLRNDLSAFYETGLVSLDSVVAISPKINLLVVARPMEEFSEQDKFKIDQYVMGGGKVLWFIDRMGITMDSLRVRPNFIPSDVPLNLEDLFFKYGVRIQPNLLLDLECTRIPLISGKLGSGNQYEAFPWYYHPLVAPKSNHPIVKSLDRVNLFFPSSIDLVKTKTDVKQTVLLETSEKTRMQYSPVTVNFDQLRYKADPAKFNKGSKPVAVLVEGEFPSLYENRVTPQMEDGLKELGMSFQNKSKKTKMIVVSDGDLPKNLYDPENENYQPLGFNRFEKHVFKGNKNFVVNCIEYLLDDEGVIEARGKDIKLRMLDRQRISQEQTYWQFINVALPLILLALFGFGFNFWRRRKYTK